MIFITVTQRAVGRYEDRQTTIRGDHILQMNPTAPDPKDDRPPGTWTLVMHTGWIALVESQEQIKKMIADELAASRTT